MSLSQKEKKISQLKNPWHHLSTTEIYSLLNSNPDGLDQLDSIDRLQKFGANKLPSSTQKSLILIFLKQFQNPLIYILLCTSLVSLLQNEFKDAFFILIILTLNACIGSFQEWKAQKSSHALRSILSSKCLVKRNKNPEEIPVENLVPGDVLLLESGTKVPADIRILSCKNLLCDESQLTGESYSVSKNEIDSIPLEATLMDQKNMLFAGSMILKGRAQGIVVSTGSFTQLGQIAKHTSAQTELSAPLLKRMETFSKNIAIIILFLSAIIAWIGIYFRDYTWQEMIKMSVALAVSAIPEGLPVAITVVLTVAAFRMSKRNVITKTLAAVEGLGSCTVIASDKTGTLTCNELTIKKIILSSHEQLNVSGIGFSGEGDIQFEHPLESTKVSQKNLSDLIEVSCLCNEAKLSPLDQNSKQKWIHLGDTVDIAFLALCYKNKMTPDTTKEKYPLVDVIPYESDLQFSASLHQIRQPQPNESSESIEYRIAVKGAPEKILTRCDLTAPELSAKLEQVSHLASQGFKVLALAQKIFRIENSSHPKLTESMVAELDFLGLCGMIDPLRAEAKLSIRNCHEAGIHVLMITGDHQHTAFAIGKELGLCTHESQVMEGQTLKTTQSMSDSKSFANKLKEIKVFARVTPEQKLNIVDFYKNSGEFIAVTGDGVNDAPALRAANIGIAMGKKGTDVARESADLVLSDDNFASIVGGIREGRIAYDNLRNVIALLMSTGAAEILIVFLAVVLGDPIPLLPVQLLWLNLVTNGIQDAALAFESGEADVLKRNPRPPKESIFNRIMIERSLLGALCIGGISYLHFYWNLHYAKLPIDSARNQLLLLMVLFEIVHLFNCRSETISAFRIKITSNLFLMLAICIALSLQVIAMHTNFLNEVLKVMPVDTRTWLILAGLSITVLITVEIHKFFRKS